MKCFIDGCDGHMTYQYTADGNDLPREADTYNYMMNNKIPYSTQEAFAFSPEELQVSVVTRYKIYRCSECDVLTIVSI